MTYQPHELSNLSLAGKYFSKLTSDDVSKRFYSGEKYVSSLTNRLKFLLATDSILAELHKFYPYQPLVKRTYEYYQEQMHEAQHNALAVSAIGMYATDHTVSPSISWPARTWCCPSSPSSAASSRRTGCCASTSGSQSCPTPSPRSTRITSSATRPSCSGPSTQNASTTSNPTTT